ncbi:MAG: 50S ribosomal protein L28 [Candidatus Gracilibacteria bacterium]
MSKVCQLTGKRPGVGNNRSHAMNATRRRYMPNLVSKMIVDPKTGRRTRMKISVHALRTMTKRGLV